MTDKKDPWLAVNFSWAIPGLGQFYAGKTADGVLFLVGELLTWVGYLAFLIGGLESIWWIPPLLLTSLLLRGLSGWLAFDALRMFQRLPKNPWLAFLLTRLLPGLGHAYAKRWFRAVIFFLLPSIVALLIAQSDPMAMWLAPVLALIGTLALLDSFFILRQYNLLTRKPTLVSIGILTVLSQVVLFLLLVRVSAFELFKVPTVSMSPTIHPGDHIVVGKAFFRPRNIERFDIVAFRFPLDQKRSFIKRVVGMPGEKIFFEDGDVYYRRESAEEKRFRIARKSAETQETVWIDLFPEAALSTADSFGRRWKKAGGKGGFDVRPGQLSTFEQNGSRSVRFETVAGSEESGDAVHDLRLRMRVEVIGNEGMLRIEVINRYGRFSVNLSPSERSYLEADLEEGRERVWLRTRRIRTGRPHVVELAVHDGLVRVLLDGEPEAEYEFLEYHDTLVVQNRIPTLAFESKKLILMVTKLEAGRDIHYRQKAIARGSLPLDGSLNALYVPEGSMFVMGDNVLFSHDSRSWVRHIFLLKTGEKVVCEGAEIVDSWDRKHQMKTDLGWKAIPDIVIRRDQNGRRRWFNRKDLVYHEKGPFPYLGRSYLVGKALRIYWPPRRAGGIR